MNENELGVTDEVRNVQPERGAEAMEARTKAVVAALREALDKVYDEDGDHQVRRLARDCKEWGGVSDLFQTKPSGKSK